MSSQNIKIRMFCFKVDLASYVFSLTFFSIYEVTSFNEEFGSV